MPYKCPICNERLVEKGRGKMIKGKEVHTLECGGPHQDHELTLRVRA